MGGALSSGQRRLWTLHQMDPAGTEYHVVWSARIGGESDASALTRALLRLVERHELLRTRYVADETGEPMTLIDDDFRIPVRSRTVGPADHWRDAVRDEVDAPFDLAAAPPIRAIIIETPGAEPIVVIVLHHIITDGWSQRVLTRDLNALYEAETGGRPADLPELAVSYADHIATIRARLSGDAGERLLGYWRTELAGFETLELPTDRPRPSLPDPAGANVSFLIPSDLTAALRDLAQRERALLSSAVLATFQLLLSVYSGQPDVTVGTVLAGRDRRGLADVVGFFANTVAIRGAIVASDTFGALVRSTHTKLTRARAHQHAPFEQVVAASGIRRAASRNPIFDVLAVHHGEFSGAPVDGPLSPIEWPEQTTRFDLELDTAVVDGELQGVLTYRTALFDADTADTLVGLFLRIVEQVIAHPDRALLQLSLQRDEDRRQFDTVNRTYRPGAFELVPGALADQTRATPDQVALVYDGTDYTYRQLDAWTDRIAAGLVERGIRPEDVIALAMPRSAAQLAGAFAAWKVGAVVLSIDAELPRERVASMLGDSDAVLALTEGALIPGVPTVTCPPAPATGDAEMPAFLPYPIRPANAAYVIFTSGSTGRPKGVVVEHGALANLYAHHAAELFGPHATRLGRRLRTALTASLAFDTAWEGPLAMVAGHELHLVTDEVRRDAHALVAYAAEQGIDFMDLTPSYAVELLDTGLLASAASGPSILMIGGEALGPTLAADILAAEGVVGLNFYGPTEYTVDALSCRIETDRPVIGRPLWNTAIRILDANLAPVPVGVPGELYLSGAQLARGYAGRANLTAERFVADPYGPPGARMYRTGDRARLRADGDVEYMGRLDSQVKVNGYRIEPLEIEAVLSRDRDVRQVAVVVHTPASGPGRLVAYVVPTGDSVDPQALRRTALDRLPTYMVPAAYVMIDRLPLTASGKLDVRRLPPPRASAPTRTAARTDVESVLGTMFADLLGLDRVGTEEDFFALGGHSLLATRLINRIRATMGGGVTLRDVFENPTVAGLAAALSDADGGRPSRVELTPQRRPGRVPLSNAQRRLWFLHQTEAFGSAYNVPLIMRLSGPLDTGALRLAFTDLLRRHEILRTCYPHCDGVPYQRVLDMSEVDLPYEHGTIDPVDADKIVNASQDHRFGLEQEIPIRVSLFALGGEKHVLSIVVHHIAIDGWAADILWRDLGDAYRARRSGRPPAWTPLPIQYADYALKLDERTRSGADADGVAYWREALAGSPPELDLPFDRPRPAEADMVASTATALCPAGVHQRLRDLARRSSASMLMVVTAGIAGVLQRVGAGNDLPIGTMVAGRTEESLDEVIGFFVNTVVLRIDAANDPTFADLVQRVRDVTLGAFERQDVPFERIVEELRPQRLVGTNPLFQVSVSVTGAELVPAGFPGVVATAWDTAPEYAKFDLHFDVIELSQPDGTPAGLDCRLAYRGDLFEAATAERLVRMLVAILAIAADRPDVRIGDIDLPIPAGKTTLPSRTPPSPNRSVMLGELFAGQARRTPAATAVRFDGLDTTYGQLNLQANRIAHYLRAHGAGPDTRIAVVLPPGPEYLATIVGVTKCGAAFVPVDPRYPADRIAYILAAADPLLTITTPIDAANFADDDPPATGRPDDCAYVIFTSGSTGRPKGVMITHAGIAALLDWSVRDGMMASGDVMLAHASCGFDASVLEIWFALAAGAAVAPAPSGLSLDVASLIRYARASGVTHALFVPSHLAEALPHLGDAPIQIFAGGEALPASVCARAEGVRNLYGPTETTILVTGWDGASADITGPTAPIGVAVGENRLHVLDWSLRPVPSGVRGELYIAGPQLARGYHGRPDLTAERFVANPFGAPGERMYRTGDVVRCLASGDLEFVGRSDDQVKIRGFRIEPGEVEAEMARLDGVEQVAVVVREDTPGDKRLVGYVSTSRERFDVELLRADLAVTLPAHLVPADIVLVDRFPLTTNGKLDRGALPAPVFAGASVAAPRTPREEIIRDLFADTLGGVAVGVHDDFFALGGHSLMTMRLVAGLRARLGIDLTVDTVFRASTPAALAAALEPDGSGSAFGAVLPIRAHGLAEPLFCVPPITGLSWCYVGLLRHLPSDVPVYGLQSRGLDGDENLPPSVAEIVEDHVRDIRERQPHGPYRLLGWSFGGNVAHAIAVALQDAGEDVSMLAMLDSYPADDSAADGSIDHHLEDGALTTLTDDRLDAIARVARNNARCLTEHTAGVYRGDVLFIRATDDDFDKPDPSSWQASIDGRLTVHDAAAGHYHLMRPKPLSNLARAVAARL